MRTIECDFLVVGSGIGGLLSAIHLSPHGKVLLITKKRSADSSSNFAQGGIACVTEPDDTFEQHVADTLDAGAGLCDEAVVREIVTAAPERIRELEQFGVHFNTDEETGSGYDLGREGGHSCRRVLHAGDITGQKIETALLAQAQKSDNITIMEHARLIDLVMTARIGLPGANRCIGAYAIAPEPEGIFGIRASFTILATGGCGKVYLYTSNPDIATGDGVAIGWRAGAAIANMEFIQFHPTCLYHPKAKNFLISEAVRGEGAELVDRDGQPFMHKYDQRGSLAPRDIVARAIDAELKRTAAPYCCLDIRHQSREFLQNRFPNIYAKCLSYGIDMATDLIPIVPAAHYCCGGIRATVEGVTNINGLYALGEVACTGLHGANRLASNSLLEALVCANAMAKHVAQQKPADNNSIQIPDWESGHAVPGDERVIVAHNWMEVRTCMWDYVGIVRSNKRLERAFRRIRNIRNEIRQYYFDTIVTEETLELRNLADVAELIIRSAHLRKESRGLHYTLDYPERLPEIEDTILPCRPSRLMPKKQI